MPQTKYHNLTVAQLEQKISINSEIVAVRHNLGIEAKFEKHIINESYRELRTRQTTI